MERKALNSLGYMELAAFFVFGTFLLGLYYGHCVVAMGYSYFVYFAYGGSIALSFPL